MLVFQTDAFMHLFSHTFVYVYLFQWKIIAVWYIIWNGIFILVFEAFSAFSCTFVASRTQRNVKLFTL